MAIIKDQNEQDQAGGQLGSQASSTVSAGAVGNPAASGASPQAKGSGNFVNLSRYMNANQGNEAVDNSVNDINKIGQGAQDQFKGAQDNFNSLKVDAPRDLSQSNQDYLNNFNPKSFSYKKDATGRATSNELDDIGANLAGTQYNGPSASDIGTSYDNYTAAKGGLDTAQKTFESSPDGTALRRQNLTDTNTQRAGGNYGAGEGNLDSLLVENRGQAAFNPQRQALSNLANGYNANNTAARAQSLTNQAQSAQALTDKANNTYKPQFQNIQNTFNTAAGYNNYGAAGGGSASANGTQTKPVFGASTASSVAAANKPTPAPVAQPSSPGYDYDRADAIRKNGVS